MPGDPASRNDDELLSQIDELKARMDRLMRGGTSTSNSALLTDAARAQQTEAEEEPAAPVADPDRTRVRDLIPSQDTEVIEIYPGPKQAVPFPEGQNQGGKRDRIEPEERAEPESPKAVDGSVVKVPAGSGAVRSPVETFDQLGNAIQQELARDESVPAAETKKGPDLASRFGPAEDVDPPPAAQPPEVDLADEPVKQEDPLSGSGPDDEPEYEFPSYDAEDRRGVGVVARIWVATALASGALATLHFVGII